MNFDDLADSGYLEGDQFLGAIKNAPTSHLKQSMDDSQQYIDFNADNRNHEMMNNFEYSNSNKHNNQNKMFNDSYNFQGEDSGKTPDHFKYLQDYQKYAQQQQQLDSENYSNVNQLAQLTNDSKYGGARQFKQDSEYQGEGFQRQQAKRNYFEERDQVEYEDDDVYQHLNQQAYTKKALFANFGIDLQNSEINQLKNMSQQLEDIQNQLKMVGNNQPLNNYDNNLKQQNQSYQQYDQNEQSFYSKQFQSQNQYERPNIQAINKNLNLLNLPTGPSQKDLNNNNSLIDIVKKPMDPSNKSSLNSGCEQEKDFSSSNEISNYKQSQQSSNINFYQNSQLSGFQKLNNNQPPNLATGYFQQMLPQERQFPSTTEQFYNNRQRDQHEKENFDQNIIHRGQSQIIQDKNEIEAIKNQNNHQYARQMSEQDQRRKQIMDQIDKVPIKDFNKMNKNDNFGQAQPLQETFQPNQDQEIDESSLTLEQRLDPTRPWKKKLAAYQELKELFENNPTHNQNFENEDGEEYISPFIQYSPYLEKAILDPNLTAQYEGLCCLLAFMRHTPDKIRLPFQPQDILLDKIQLNKQHFREVVHDILLLMINKDRQQILQALLKRFKNKNVNISMLAMQVIAETLPQYENSQLKQVIKEMSDREILIHQNKEIRDYALTLLKLVFTICEDDPTSIMKQFKNLKPEKIKEFKEALSQVDKSKSQNLHQLYGVGTQTQQQFHGNNENVSVKHKRVEQQDHYEDKSKGNSNAGTEIDLTYLVPSNFNEIPYLTQINIKKKSLEQFNQELEKIIQKNQQHNVIITKDYSSIYNVIVHLLEDSNMLVFSEAFKSVEYLTLILGRNIKQAKIKQFLQLLTEKFKETKSAVINQINKVISTIVDQYCLPLNSLLEYLVSTLAQNNKNPRVKQLILEKVDSIIVQNEHQLSDENLLTLFKAIKDNLKEFIIKDTNANVRDAAVALLTQFKRLLPTQQIVTDIVNTLPKYRVQEIIKKAQEVPKQIVQEKPIQLKQQNNVKSEQVNKDKEQFYQGRTVSAQYQTYVDDFILSVKKLSQGQFMNADQLKMKWEENIEKLGEQGLNETKQIIVYSIYWYLSTSYRQVNDKYPIQILDNIAYLIKTIYCIVRNVEILENSNRSEELEQCLQIANILFGLTSNKRQFEALYNILLTATGFAQVFLNSMKLVLQGLNQEKFFSEFSNKQVDIMEMVFNWTGSQLEIFASKGILLSDVEDLRSIGVLYINDQMTGEDSFILAIMNFQQRCKNVFIQGQLNQKPQQQDPVQKKESPIQQQEQEISRKQELQEEEKTLTQQFVEIVGKDLDKGFSILKQLSYTQEIQEFHNKEQVCAKLINIIETHFKTPQQQAYSLKALLWFKQELLGVEDCFKLSSYVIESFIRTELGERDSSVEVFLINNWTNELSLRDIIDRIAFVSKDFSNQGFLIIFKWLQQERLQAAFDQSACALEDFRKLCVYIGRCIENIEIKEFVAECIKKFGIKRLREFMEIQLMHSPQEYNSFMDWFSLKYRDAYEQQYESEQLKLPQIKVEDVSNEKQKKNKVQNKRLPKANIDVELANALQTNTNNDESEMPNSARGNVSIHSQLYQQLREKRKSINQRKQQNYDTNESSQSTQKYQEIISQLENKLQIKNATNKQQENVQDEYQSNKPTSLKKYNDQQEKLNSRKQHDSDQEETKQYQSNQNNFYNQLEDNQEEEELDSSRVFIDQYQNQPQINNYQEKQDNDSLSHTENKLKQSIIKENRWREELTQLELEKKLIEQQKEMLMKEKNHETYEWKQKFESMKEQHAEVIENLAEANKCYLVQVDENEDLKNQLRTMQEQHRFMMKRFEEIESKIQQQSTQKKNPVQDSLDSFQHASPQKKNNVSVVKEESLYKIQEIFSNVNNQVSRVQNNSETCIKRVQELLLNTDNKSDSKEFGQSIYFYYSQMKNFKERLDMIRCINSSLDNQDVLFALQIDIYTSLLNFLLRAFAQEKSKIERDSVSMSTSTLNKGFNEQNEITTEVQKIVSKLLNSKEFTTSLVTLFQILREAIVPVDMNNELSDNDKQFFRVLMRCIARISKALHSENPDLIRGFDVLIEMQKIFVTHPPECLRENMPSLSEFDFIYRTLKDVTDRLMELQPDKVRGFLSFIQNQKQNAFLMYMKQVTGFKDASNQSQQYQDEEDEYNGQYNDVDDDMDDHNY